jgi:hypothetical protein
MSMPRVHRPCSDCPWRRDAEPGHFSADRYEALRSTVRQGDHQPMPGDPLFACHATPEGLERPCASWLAIEGSEHIGVRLLLAQGRLDPEAMEIKADWPALYDSFEEMVLAQGLRRAEET